MRKKHISPEVSIALRSTAAIGLVLIIIFVLFTNLLRQNLNRQKSKQLRYACNQIYRFVKATEFFNDDFITAFSYSFLELPYFIDYAIIDGKSHKTLFSNNKFIPALPRTHERTAHYFKKNYFMDGNLDILYYSKDVNPNIYIQVSIDIENDSATKMIYSLPLALPLIIIPVLLGAFFVILIIIKRDFSKEHNFSANVSHELQTPVNAILGHAKLLDRWGKENPEQTDKSLKIIISEAKTMQSTITNLLQITKLEKKMIEPQKDEIIIQEFFEDIKNEFAYRDGLIINYSNSTEVVITDRNLLHQIFVIVITNSLKFCEPPCEIQLNQFTEKHKIIFQIKDNGKGFSPEILPYIFDRFYRGDEAHSRSKGGAGLGLSIAKSISTALDMKISATNHPDGGAVIQLEL